MRRGMAGVATLVVGVAAVLGAVIVIGALAGHAAVGLGACGGALNAIVGGAVMARRGYDGDSWRWRHGRRTQLEFVLRLPPGEVIDHFLALCTLRRGWKIRSVDRSAGSVVVTTGMTPWSYTTRIDLVAHRLDGQPTAVSVRATVPQLADWGESGRVVTDIRRCLLRDSGALLA